jgi:opacity protein-like surface antigen
VPETRINGEAEKGGSDMRLKTGHFLAAIIIAVLAVTSPAGAANVEITPFAGYTMGGDFNAENGSTLSFDETSSYGVMLDFKQAEDSWVELYFSRQPTRLTADSSLFVGRPLFDVDVEYYHLGGTYGAASGRFRPFVVGTLGATYLDPKGSDLHSETKFSLSLGGGARFYLTEHLGIRFDARWFGTFFGGSGSVFCSSGTCLINVDGDVLSQFTANAGVILAF